MPLTHSINILLTLSNNNYGTWGMKRGTAFIRALFLFLLVILILKLAYDMVKPA